MGFSDITYLRLSLLQRCNLGSIYGCLAGSTAQASVRQLLMTTDPSDSERSTGNSPNSSAQAPSKA